MPFTSCSSFQPTGLPVPGGPGAILANLDWEKLLQHSLAAIVFAIIGLAFFALVFRVIVGVTPFSIRKEIEEDQNIALSVIIGSVIIGMAIIIAAAIHGT